MIWRQDRKTLITIKTHIVLEIISIIQGGNFKFLVNPFIDKYSTTTDTKICSGDTSWASKQVEVFIHIFGQGLWFGRRMDW